MSPKTHSQKSIYIDFSLRVANCRGRCELSLRIQDIDYQKLNRNVKDFIVPFSQTKYLNLKTKLLPVLFVPLLNNPNTMLGQTN